MRQTIIRRLLYFVLLIGTMRLLWILMTGDDAGFGLATGLLTVALIWFLRSFKGVSGSSRQGSGNFLLENSVFVRLRQRYEMLAKQKKEEGKYVEASRIYLNLLKDPYRATHTLEEGAQYAEAAVLYEKRLLQLPNAAECYTKAHLYDRAIVLYQRLNEPEKMGDTYRLMGDDAKAMPCYEQVVSNYLEHQQYVKAALLCRKKLADPQRAQQLLLLGWQRNQDAFNCLNNYFAAMESPELLRDALKEITADTPAGPKQDVVLRALQYEFDKGDAETQQLSRHLAHRLIAARAEESPEAIQAMRHFHESDRMLPRDVQKYKAQKSVLR